MGRAAISAVAFGCVTLVAEDGFPNTRASSERPDWRVSSLPVMAVKISWLTIPLAYDPRARAWSNRMRHPPPPASGKDQEDGLKGSSLVHTPPPPLLGGKGGFVFVTSPVRVRFPTSLWNTLLSLRPLGTAEDCRVFFG